MFKNAKLFLQSLAAALVISGSAGAATLNLDLSTAPTITNCRIASGPSACLARVAYAPSLIANPVLNVEAYAPPVVFDFLELTAIERDPNRPDLFDLNAALRFLGTTFEGTGLGSGFRTDWNFDNGAAGLLLNLYDFTNGNLTWGSIASQQVAGIGLVTVAFLPVPPALFGAGPGTNPSRVIVQASISVVPLPAGILLLGTALLGLVGLSRRRKPVAA